MVKRVYFQTALKWFLGLFIVSGVYYMPEVFTYFQYAEEIGAINITGYSDDMVCTATEWNDTENLCYAYINFTALEDNFWYPINYDPWGRNESFGFKPQVKGWKLERSWGSGWREINMSRPCYYTWCGASRNGAFFNKYSVAWREPKEYQVRITAIKYSPYDTIKWSFDIADPEWKGKRKLLKKDYFFTGR